MFSEEILLLVVSSCISLLVTGLTWTALQRSKLFDVLRDVPWAKTSGRDGFFSRLFSEPSGPELLEYMNQTPNKGFIQYTGILWRRRILVTSPELSNEILNQKVSTLRKSIERKRRVNPILGNGLIAAEGDDVKFQRKHLTPAFSYRHINSLSPLFWAKTAELIGKIRREISHDLERQNSSTEPSSIVNMSDLACRTTFDIIGVAALGKNFGTLLKPETQMLQDYLQVFGKIGQGLSQVLEVMLPTRLLYNLPLRRVWEIKSAITAMRKECRAIVENHKADHAASENRVTDILSVALKTDAFTDEGLTDQMLTFLGGGHATTAVALVWAIHFLTEHPDRQQRLREEIRTLLPNPARNDMTDICQLETLSYLGACLNETLRLMPPFPMLQRETTIDITVSGQIIPAGSFIVISPWSMQRCEKFWGPNAAEFCPERWLQKEITSKGNDAKQSLLTFGQGPRNCIGMTFAKKELETMLVGLIGCFDIKPGDHQAPLPIRHDLLVQPMEDLMVRMEALEGW